jgi:hypothetical protein
MHSNSGGMGRHESTIAPQWPGMDRETHDSQSARIYALESLLTIIWDCGDYLGISKASTNP